MSIQSPYICSWNSIIMATLNLLPFPPPLTSAETTSYRFWLNSDLSLFFRAMHGGSALDLEDVLGASQSLPAGSTKWCRKFQKMRLLVLHGPQLGCWEGRFQFGVKLNEFFLIWLLSQYWCSCHRWNKSSFRLLFTRVLSGASSRKLGPSEYLSSVENKDLHTPASGTFALL